MGNNRITLERERELSYRMKTGDLEARNMLIESQVRFVERLTKGYKDENLTQECLLRLMNQISDFNPTERNLGSFTKYVVKGTIARYTHPKNPGVSVLDDNYTREEYQKIMADAAGDLVRKRLGRCIDGKLSKKDAQMFQEHFLGDTPVEGADRGRYLKIVKKVKEYFTADPVLSKISGYFPDNRSLKRFVREI